MEKVTIVEKDGTVSYLFKSTRAEAVQAAQSFFAQVCDMPNDVVVIKATTDISHIIIGTV